MAKTLQSKRFLLFSSFIPTEKHPINELIQIMLFIDLENYLHKCLLTQVTIMMSGAFLTFSILNHRFVLHNDSYNYVIITLRMISCNCRCCYHGSAAARLISIVPVSVMKAAVATAGSFTGKRHLSFKRKTGAASMNQISQQAGGVRGGAFRATAWRRVTLFYPPHSSSHF